MLLPKNSYSRIGRNQVDIQIEFWNDEYATRLKSLDSKGYHQLFVFCKGGGTHEIAFVDHMIRDCSFHLIPAGTPHMIRTLRKMKGIVINCTDAYLVHLSHFDFSALEEGPKQDKYIYEAPLTEFQKLYDAILPMANDLLMQRNQSMVLNRIAVLLLKIINSHYVTLTSERNLFIADLYKQVDRLVDTKYKYKPVLSTIAKELQMAEEQLSYSLKIYLNSSLLQLQRKKILKTAKELLYKTKLDTVSISDQLGFRSEYEFLKFFRKRTNMGPEAYRINRKH